MGRLKRKSRELDKAKKRLAGLESIDPALDLGNGLTVDVYKAKINELDGSLDTYNQSLSISDKLLNGVQLDESEMGELSDRMLKGVGAKYGLDSDEYEMAGGTRKSERKRPVRKDEEEDGEEPLPENG